MKKKVSIILSLLSVFLSTFGAIAAPIEIKFSHVLAENTPTGLMAIKFKKLVEQRLNGLVVVRIYPDSQLYNDSEILDALLRGDVQMAAPSLSKLHEFNHKLKIFDLPFLFENIDEVNRFERSPAAAELLKPLGGKRLVGLGFLHGGMKQLSANRAIYVPADISDMKFRIMPSDVLESQFAAVGAIPIRTPFSEVFTLLQTKAIDGQENTWSNIYSKNIHNVQDYILESNHAVISYLLMTSMDFWHGLPTPIRGELRAIIDESVDYGNRISAVFSTIDRNLVEKAGAAKIIRISATEREEWVKAMESTWKLFEPEIGPELMEAARKAGESQPQTPLASSE